MSSCKAVCLPVHTLISITLQGNAQGFQVLLHSLHFPEIYSPFSHFVKTSLCPLDSVIEIRPILRTETTHPIMSTRCSRIILAFPLGPSIQCLIPKENLGRWDKNLMVPALSQVRPRGGASSASPAGNPDRSPSHISLELRRVSILAHIYLGYG